MSTPIDDEEIEVSLRLQPVVARPEGWRGRSNSLVAAGLVGFVLVGLVLGSAFDEGSPSTVAIAAPSGAAMPSEAAATNSPRPTRRPMATPLPTVEIVGGRIPTERRLVYADGVRVLDLATGTLVSPSRSYEDQMLPLGADGMVCACVVRSGITGADGTTTGPALRFGWFDLRGNALLERDLLTFDDVEPIPDINEGLNVTTALDAEGTTLYVLVAARRPPVWTVELLSIEVASGGLVDSIVVDRVPVDLEDAAPSPVPSADPIGSPPDGVYAWASSIVVAPDGRTIYASVFYSEVRNENWTERTSSWMVPVHVGAPGTPRPVPAVDQIAPGAWCLVRPTFIDPDLLVQVCTPADGGSAGDSYYVDRLTTAAEPLEDLRVPGEATGGYWPLGFVVDRARRAVFGWDPNRYTLSRIGVDDGRVATGEVSQAMMPGDQRPTGSYLVADSGMALSADGSRLFVLGQGRGEGREGSSTGVWVFDPETLRLLDHWEPRAFLTSLAVSADGRFVYAAGAARLDVQGRENVWPASITVYDAASGEIQVVYGAVARDNWINFFTPP